MNSDDPHNTTERKARIIAFPDHNERQKRELEKQKRNEKLNPPFSPRDASTKIPFLNVQNIPVFSGVLVLSFIFVHVALSLFADDALRLRIFYEYGFVPGAYTDTFPWQWGAAIAPLSHAFFHGGWMHLLFNVVMGLSLGMFFEKLYGGRMTALFFVLCTLAGALAYFAFNPFVTTPMVGASGGISGLFGAGLLIMSRQGQFGAHRPLRTLIFWGVFMSVPGLLMGEPVAWQAHLGGYLGGIVLLLGLEKRISNSL